jgi:hypothetical protein
VDRLGGGHDLQKLHSYRRADTAVIAVAYAGSAPKELYGKSIILTWGESRDVVSRNERPVGV